jgi:hypothetical protein
VAAEEQREGFEVVQAVEGDADGQRFRAGVEPGHDVS